MNLEELNLYLKTLTVKKLKTICCNTRNWGVYNSSTAISGYSKCKNKEELIALIFAYFARQNEPHGFYFEDNGSQWSKKITYHDFQYEKERIESNPLFSVIYQEVAA